MNSEKSHHHKHKREFSGSVEIVPPQPKFIEFITPNHLASIPIRQLDYFILSQNPDQQIKKTLPPDSLLLVFATRLVVLYGWRLESLLDPLTQGRVKRIHAEKYLGTLMIGQPWVTEISIIPRDKNVPL